MSTENRSNINYNCILDTIFPSGGAELIGYNVEYWVRWSKGNFLAKGTIIKYRKQSKNGKLSYSGGVYTILCGKRTYTKRRCEFTVVSKNNNYSI